MHITYLEDNIYKHSMGYGVTMLAAAWIATRYCTIIKANIGRSASLSAVQEYIDLLWRTRLQGKKSMDRKINFLNCHFNHNSLYHPIGIHYLILPIINREDSFPSIDITSSEYWESIRDFILEEKKIINLVSLEEEGSEEIKSYIANLSITPLPHLQVGRGY